MITDKSVLRQQVQLICDEGKASKNFVTICPLIFRLVKIVLNEPLLGNTRDILLREISANQIPELAPMAELLHEISCNIYSQIKGLKNNHLVDFVHHRLRIIDRTPAKPAAEFITLQVYTDTLIQITNNLQTTDNALDLNGAATHNHDRLLEIQEALKSDSIIGQMHNKQRMQAATDGGQFELLHGIYIIYDKQILDAEKTRIVQQNIHPAYLMSLNIRHTALQKLIAPDTSREIDEQAFGELSTHKRALSFVGSLVLSGLVRKKPSERLEVLPEFNKK